MSQAHATARPGESLMPATISATLARASEAIGHAAAILDRLEAKAKADTFARRLEPTLKKMQAKGWTQAEMAEGLNERGIKTPRGLVGRWTQGRVSRVLTRLDKESKAARMPS
jgi:hypothetical protein